MCGICGIVSADPGSFITQSSLATTRDTLTHRGPVDAGYHSTSGVAFGSLRLAILDLSPRGRMPMSTADGRYWITYNGEVYNFQDLRRILECRGCNFRSNTD